jgi:hypothetical protein
VSTPVIGAGSGFTVIGKILKQPVGIVYVMTAEPPPTPVTTPLTIPTEATDVLLLVHRPPGAEFAREVVDATHTTGAPVIAGGSGLTVTSAVIKQPESTV